MRQVTASAALRMALGTALAAALVPPIVPGLVSGLAAQQQSEREPTINVRGSGEVRVASDRARITFMVETQATTAREAASLNAQRMDRVIRAVRDAGGTTTTVETGGYQLNPIYSRPSRDQTNVPTIQAYRAVNNVHVRAEDVTRVGGLIDAAVAGGANRITSLGFEAKDLEPARLEAVRLAVTRARAEAEAAAAALGVTLGAPMEVDVGTDYPGPIVQMRGIAYDMAAVQEAPTPIEPGEQVVRASVGIRYHIGP